MDFGYKLLMLRAWFIIKPHIEIYTVYGCYNEKNIYQGSFKNRKN